MRGHLGIGSNLGDRLDHLLGILSILEEGGVKVEERSSLYETEPLHYRAQDWFLNAVIEVQFNVNPLELLQICQNVENALGRQRRIPMGPRTADVDILLLGNTRMELPSLEVPHPRLTQRRFALLPLLELDPGAVDPRDGLPLERHRLLLENALDQGLRRVAPPGNWQEARLFASPWRDSPRP